MATKVCNVNGCPTLTDGAPRCQTHTRQADHARGTAHTRGYDTTHRRNFREAVLARNPVCTIRGPGCTRTTTVADHWPHSRRQLVDLGLNPNNPDYGRGTCHTCHSRETAKLQPGGWNANAAD